MIDIAAALPTLLPRAIAWAEAEERRILSQGRPLTDIEIQLSRAVGVKRPERVRICAMLPLPMPEDPELRAAALETGLLGPGTVGLTLGYGIYVASGHATARLVSHECRHVHQYEVAGSIAAYLPQYLLQIVQVGYQNAPFEVDARNWERHRP